MFILSHIGLVVEDINRSMNFYANVLNFSVGEYKADQEIKLLMLHNDTTTIELIERRSDPFAPRQTGLWDHLTFQVDDMYQVLKRLQEHNVELIDKEPRMSLFGKNVLFFYGPDGERIEFIEK